jgi:hypothetical protein
MGDKTIRGNFHASITISKDICQRYAKNKWV